MFLQNNVDSVISLNNISMQYTAILAVVRIDISDKIDIFFLNFARSMDCRHTLESSQF